MLASRYVGRKHQPELLKRSVAQDCLPFMSRDHFSICFDHGEFRIRTLTSNPIWRVRSDAEPVELQRGEPVDLQSGRHRCRHRAMTTKHSKTSCTHFALTKLG